MRLNEKKLALAREMVIEARAVVPHTDADGLAAGAIALRARRESADDAILFHRGETPFGDKREVPRKLVAVLDWGVRAIDRPAVFVDHHAPVDEPRDDQLVISSYGEPAVSTSVLMKRIMKDASAWLTAVGAAGDYGDDGLKQPECEGVLKSVVKKLVPLINAPRRVKDGPVREALAILVEHDDPRDALKDKRIKLLEDAKAQWRSAFAAAMKTAPVVNDEVALILFESDCQIHPLVATAWSQRLSPRAVIAANKNYIAGRVNFAMRGGDGDLRKILREAMPHLSGEYALGHDRATGGSVTHEEFEEMVAALGLKMPAKIRKK